ncbi:Photosystem I P700 chlorophyll a apoprotein A1 [Platanthera guangdongensis]|uniref:Photosystem I P700 chlorophyll a apoprotein A1 n=1 Tax=Platanthera guangdongensis TaxID=2320717 RepID=A0ABR2M7F9_9ASPA
MVGDYNTTTRYNDLLDCILRHRDAIISHLNWACIFLGFHSFGLYIHNDTMSALGSPQWGGGELIAVGGKVALLPIPLGTADFLVHHIRAFTIHMTVLILLKGVLFARSSRLIPNKANLGFCFSCDGHGRGYMPGILLGSYILRSILDVQCNFRSNFPFQLENAVGCLGYYK